MKLPALANNTNRALVSIAFSLISLASVVGAQIQTFVQTGDPAPSAGTTFVGFGLPSINNAGQVVYVASLNTDYGIYRSLIPIPGAVQVLRPGDAAPGGGIFVHFANLFDSPLAITSSGETTFAGTSQNGGVEDSIFGISSTGVGTRFFTAGGTAAPGGNGILNGLPSLLYVSYNDNSQVAFYDTLSGTSNGSANDEGVFRAGTSPGSLVQIVREGAPVPDGSGTFGVSLASAGIAFGIPSLSGTGTVAFRAGVVGSTNSFDAGIFTGNGGGIVQIARAGQTGIPGGGTFVSFLSEPAINSQNQVAFTAEFEQGTKVSNAIYRNDAGTLIEIAHDGEALPGGGFIESVADAVEINDAGQVALLITTNTSGLPNLGSGGIIRGSGGPLTLIARDGQATPRGGGSTFLSFSGQVFAMNALGDIAFTALLSNASKGLFLYSDRFGLLELAVLGEPLNGSTITGLDLAGANAFSRVSSHQMGLNDTDQVAFRYQLANGKKGIAVWSFPGPIINLLTLAVQWNIAGAGDLNGDGFADLVWENTSTGQRAIWFLQNGAISSTLNLPTIAIQWRIAGVGDFNGDGDADLVWQNTTTGQRAIWFLKNGVLSSSILLPTVAIQWHIVGVGDFDRDGFADLVWENASTGQRAIWFLKNGVLSSSVLLPTVAVQWHIAGIGDFDNDGNSDLVWENTSTGQRAIWLLKNGAFSGTISLPTTAVAWHIAGAADFNDNGFGDLVWENTSTGQRAIWLLKNGVLSQQ